MKVILYDGECGLCTRLVQFLLKRDKHQRLHYASLQSETGQAVLERHGLPQDDFNSAVFVYNFGTEQEKIKLRSRAVLACLSQLGWGWRFIASLLRVWPRFIADAAYNFVARNRSKWFIPSCPVPSSEQQKQFLD